MPRPKTIRKGAIPIRKPYKKRHGYMTKTQALQTIAEMGKNLHKMDLRLQNMRHIPRKLVKVYDDRLQEFETMRNTMQEYLYD